MHPRININLDISLPACFINIVAIKGQDTFKYCPGHWDAVIGMFRWLGSICPRSSCPMKATTAAIIGAKSRTKNQYHKFDFKAPFHLLPMRPPQCTQIKFIRPRRSTRFHRIRSRRQHYLLSPLLPGNRRNGGRAHRSDSRLETCVKLEEKFYFGPADERCLLNVSLFKVLFNCCCFIVFGLRGLGNCNWIVEGFEGFMQLFLPFP